MRQKIEAILPDHTIVEVEDSDLFVVDYKNCNGGEVEIHSSKPDDIKSVHISNPNLIKMCFDGFRDNALPISRGRFSKQCECAIFPTICTGKYWILFIETKYACDFRRAFSDNADYPRCMIDQIIETVSYFREKGIIERDKRVNAIVSFPNLIQDFSGSFFSTGLSAEDILFDHKILIRPTNKARVISEKRIVLGV